VGSPVTVITDGGVQATMTEETVTWEV